MAALFCPHQPSCPGCPRLAEPGLPAEPLDRLTTLMTRLGGPAPVVRTSPLTGFRRRAKLAIRGRADAPKLGIFEAGSHRTVHIPRCLVHHPVINRVAASVRDTLARHRVPTYSETAHAGVARYLQVVVERSTDLAQVTLVTNSSSPSGLEPLFASLIEALGDELHSLWWNGNPERTNTIFGPHWQKLVGEPCVADLSGRARIFYPPQAFGQSNLDLAMALGARVRDLASPGARIAEFYAGVGAIGLGLAESAASLQLNELGEGSLQGLRLGVSQLPEPLQAKVQVHAGPAGAFAALVPESTFVIADPPRKGLDPTLLGALAKAPPERFVYVSCDIDSFERDAAKLLEGPFRLSLLEAYDLFPHTEHLETMACFERT